jgi:formiminoglutamase
MISGRTIGVLTKGDDDMAYHEPESSLYEGHATEGYYSAVIHCCSVEAVPATPGICLLGFASDLGATVAGAKPGHQEAPRVIRKALRHFAYHGPSVPVYDVGDIVGEGESLEALQMSLGEHISALREKGHVVIVLGGTNDTVWGHYQALKDVERLHLINWGAHFDLDSSAQPSSKTPFHQIADHCASSDTEFRYLGLGIQPLRNTQDAFESAAALGANYVEAEDEDKIERVLRLLNTNKALHAYYVSLCLDVFSKAVAPGVNEASPLGLRSEVVFQGLRQLAASGKVVAFDVLELNPTLDVHQQTAQLAAVCIAEFIRYWKPVPVEED